MEFIFIQIWLQMVLWFLIQNQFQILKIYNKESCSLFNLLHNYILFDIFRAREGKFLIKSIWIGLKIFK
jgi:hypothetical protein